MEITGLDYRKLLQEELEKRRAKNGRYSLRSFARFLKLNPTTLSLVLRGRRTLSEDSILRVTKAFGMEPAKAAAFRAMVLATDAPSAGMREKFRAELQDFLHEQTGKYQQLSLAKFQLIADWYNVIVFELLGTKAYRELKAEVSVPWLAERIGLSKTVIEESLDRLARLGLAAKDAKGKFEKTDEFISAGDEEGSRAIQLHHEQFLDRAREALHAQDKEERDFSGLLFAMDKKRLPELKKEIQEFRRHLHMKYRDENASDIYRLSVQLFRATHPIKKGSHR